LWIIIVGRFKNFPPKKAKDMSKSRTPNGRSRARVRTTEPIQNKSEEHFYLTWVD
jgi:hypothetical protein